MPESIAYKNANSPDDTAAMTSPGTASMAELNVTMREAILRTVTTSEDIRPKNTRRNYDPKQREWEEWCERRGFEVMTRHQVTSEKLHLFLEECVVGRASKRSKKGTGDDVVSRLSESTVRGYVNAIVNLYTQQKARGVNNAPHPRNGPVRMLLNVRKVEELKRKRTEYVDRAKDTALSGYQMEGLLNVSHYFMKKNSDVGIRDRLTFLLCHFALLRGENARMLELPDIHHLPLQGEGPTDCFAVVLILMNGKTNQAGRLEYGSFLRNKDAFICPVGALALYLFTRFHHSGEPFPDFSASSKWYDIKIIKNTKDVTQPISHDTHCKSVKAAFNACGVTSKAMTHAARRSGAQAAEAGGASEASVRRAGRWNQSTMESCYLTHLPRQVLRSHAGFNAEGGSYFIRRDVVPPDELLTQIWPLADTWERAVEAGMRADGRPVEVNVAAKGFLRLLIRLRSVFVQDAVLWKQRYPDLFLWSHPMFSSPAFCTYEQKLLEHLKTPDTSVADQIKTVLPLIAEQMQAYSSATIAHFDQRTTVIQSEIQAAIQLSAQQAQEQRIRHEQQVRGLQAAIVSLLSHGDQSSTNLHRFGNNESSGHPVPLGSSSTILPEPAPAIPQLLASAPSDLDVIMADPLAVSRLPARMPSMSQDRSLSTVADLWREWKEGLRGMPSVEKMDEDWGSEWRRSDKDRKHHERRARIIRHVEHLAASRGVSHHVAIMMLDHARLQQPNKSLAKLAELVRDDSQLQYPSLDLGDLDTRSSI